MRGENIRLKDFEGLFFFVVNGKKINRNQTIFKPKMSISAISPSPYRSCYGDWRVGNSNEEWIRTPNHEVMSLNPETEDIRVNI